VRPRGEGWSNKSSFVALLQLLRGIIRKILAPTGPYDGESIDRARSRYNALLFHAHVACPDREPMLCILLAHVQDTGFLSTPSRACKDGRPRRRKRLSLLALLLLLGAAGAFALQDLLSVLVKLELGDDDLGGRDRNGNRLAVALLADDCADD